MAVTYEPIEAKTLTSSSSSVTFSSIPGTYTDLILISSAKMVSSAQDLRIRFNSDTASNYSQTYVSGDGTTTYSGRATNQTFSTIDNYGYIDTTNFNISIHHIMNYANTTTFKTTLSRSSNASTGTDAIVSLWRKTPEAITSITLLPSGTSQNFATGTTFTLYGIKAA